MTTKARSKNSVNPAKGKAFQEGILKLVSKYFGVELEMEVPLGIGSPAKDHKFDFASADRKVIGECKNYCWTAGGNVPSAKMGFVNEAVFYLSFLPKGTKQFVVLRRDFSKKRKESLAEYYFRTYRHLIGNVKVLEVDLKTKKVIEVK